MPDLQNLLDQIDRLDQEATKGPWEVWEATDDDGTIYPECMAGPKNELFGARGWDDTHYIQEIPELTMADAEFIALSRTAMPALAQAVRGVLDVLDGHPAPRKEADPTGYATTRLELLEHRVREAITEAIGDTDDQ